MGLSMRQVIGLWGKNYSEVATFLNFKHKSTIEKRMSSNSWKHHEVISILNEIEKDTGIRINPSLVNR